MDDWPREEDGEMTSLSLSMICLGMQLNLSNLKCHFHFHWNKNVGTVFTSKMMIANFTFSFKETFWNASPSTTLKMSPSPQVGLEPLMAMEKLGHNFAIQIKFQVNWKFYNFGKKTQVIFSRWGLPGIGYLVRGENRPRLLEVKGSR